MLKRLDLRGIETGDWRPMLPRPQAAKELPVAAVQAILAEVRTGGDAAVRQLTERFDGVRVDSLRVPAEELRTALDGTPRELRAALEAAHAAVLAFHQQQVRGDEDHDREGVRVREVRRPVERAGVYVPGGTAPLLSSVLMSAVPARVAGVPAIALCSPPTAAGSVAPPILAAAALAGVDEVYRIGGAQSVAAMAYGTESVPAVDVIVGPGNVYVSLAKREVAGEGVVGVPGSFAGPSEVVVIADDTTPVAFAATDVVVQAEHGPDGLAWLVTWSERMVEAVSAEVAAIVAASPRRSQIEATLGEGGYAVLVDGPEQALEVANAIAPEHLQLMCEGAEDLVALVRHAGAVFCGRWAPASVGDYVAGPSHVLPTYGSARFASALRVDDFVRTIHVVSLDEAALGRLAPHVVALAEAEGLAAHADSVRIRGRG